VLTQHDARKAPLSGDAALALARDVDEIYAVKGKQVVHVAMSAKPSKEELTALLIGPTGNLRAPTIRSGRTLVVGFDEATYARVLR
jgi:hypothetical protein